MNTVEKLDMAIDESELNPCPKCGGKGMYVTEDGWSTEGAKSKYVSCHRIACMPHSEKYTVKEWQGLERPESQESRAEHERMASELSHEVSDVRILSLLQLVQDIITYPERSCDFVSTWLDEHPDLDNPDVEAKAATLRAMVS